MRQLRALLLRLSGLFNKEQRDRDLEEELESHLLMHVEDNLRRGMTREEARRHALIQLGGLEQTKERYRERWGLPRLETVWQDARFGLRMLRKSPSFTAIAVLTLALGIGVNAGIFQIFNGLALRPLELPGSQHVLTLYQTFHLNQGPMHRNVFGSGNLFSYYEYKEYRDQNHVFSGLLSYAPFVEVTLAGEQPRQLLGTLASCNYFEVLGVRPELGRTFTEPDCDQTGSGAVVVLSDEMWRNTFAADPALIGKAVSINRVPLTIIGVAPRGFAGTEVVPSAFWAPLTMQHVIYSSREQEGDMLADDELSWLQLMGRVRGDFSNGQVLADLRVIAARLDRRHPGFESKLAVATSTLFVRPEERHLLLGGGVVVLFSVGLVLLIACANVASLLLARAATRRREIAIRLATGASRGRLMRQLLTESLLLALFGGALGSLLAFWSFEAALKFTLSHLPEGFTASNLTVAPDLRVLAYTLALTLLTAIAFGLAPAFEASRMDLSSQLKDVGADLQGDQTHGGLLRRSLVGLQIAVSMILLLTAGLLLRGLYRAQTIDPGFSLENTAAVSAELASQGYSGGRAAAFRSELIDRLSALPGVEAVAQASSLPLGNSHQVAHGSIPGHEESQRVELNAVSRNFFATMAIPIVRGRTFSDAEVQTDAKAIIVTEATARLFWPGEDPVGKRLVLYRPGNPVYDVVGVAKDAQVSHLGEAHPIYLYIPAGADKLAQLHLLVRTAGTGASLKDIRTTVRALDPQLVANVVGLEDYLEFWRAPARVAAGFSAALGGLALLLASAGVYGTVSFAVSRRIREIGIRMALGANGQDVMRLILRQALHPVLIGAAAGITTGAGVSRLLSTVLFGLSSLDPIAFFAVPAFLLAVALLASYLPARRACRVDPMVALRYE